MAEKDQQAAQTNGYGHVDPEGRGAHEAREMRKKKRTKCILYIVLFAIFQCAVVAVFAVVIAKVRTPRFRVQSGSFENLTGSSPSMNVHFSVRNANFGRYNYRETNVEFFYQGASVGQVVVPNSHVGWRTTRRINEIVNLNLGGNTQLTSDLSSGVVRITSQARMTGRVAVIFFMKKNRATNMNCTMDIIVANRQLENIVCN